MYVMGGETRKTGPNASIGLGPQRTYNRVDVYHLDQNKWTKVRLLVIWLPAARLVYVKRR